MPASIFGEVDHPSEAAAVRERSALRTLLDCPSCGSSHVAQVLGDNGGVSYVCTACGHSWS
ncbi:MULTISPECIES: IS1 family transposase [Streptomyces]|uniref:IS1 family transposase n=1 Tax=Streptomyces venezuelae TaxID=54571 RepID=A0A5P2CFH6_STRVZ|nr:MULTISPECIES: IS1 family transposase [Streptomyces]QES41586.1 hypothetical protein DEJ49_11680 [Streptomyces venezuelae]WAL95471.1 hypothetical protein NOO62_13800 [Streptomyces sp. Je 1-369]